MIGRRLTGGLVRIVAVGADGGAVALAQVAHILTPGKRAIIRKIAWRNRTGVNGNLLIGFGDRTVAGNLFRQVFPAILMINGIDDKMEEGEVPIMGNGHEGFSADTTVPTGTVGNILVATDAALVAVATPVEVTIEVEEF